ncbi:unnamed protein product [Clavelina lepadiformis]|uniref:Amidase domain-containing protein n=1 Tax=Clavelina lepadiformis TaxID=159417 RepID=A0ABP0FG94_CLALP
MILNITALLVIAVIAYLFWFVFLRRHGYGPQQYIERKEGDYDMSYNSKIIKVPFTSGFLLRLLTKLQNSLFGSIFLVNFTLRNGEFTYFRDKKFNENPTFYPCQSFNEECAIPGQKDYSDEQIENLSKTTKENDGFQFNTISNYVSKYKSGYMTPSDVAEKAIRAFQEIKPLNAIVKYNVKSIRQMAAASTERYKNNCTLSPVDGVLVVIKDEYAVKGFHYSKGTCFLGQHEVAKYDSQVVERLRKLGVIILAIANMHELGMGTSGNNANKEFGPCRTPYNVNHYSGGSSSGSASATASGLCVAAVGSDGGGSVRIPSSYCGVVGLKPTFARINLSGVEGLSNTVGHCGPICTNVRDTAIFYALLGGPDPGYELGLKQPRLKLPDFEGDLKGFKIGIDRRYFKDCLKDVNQICEDSLIHLEGWGANVQSIEIPELQDTMIAHRISILAEMTTGMIHGFNNNFESLTAQLRILMRVGHSITATDYLQANKQRTRSIKIFKKVFQEVDAVVTPTTGHCAPPVLPSEISDGAFNGQQDALNMR